MATSPKASIIIVTFNRSAYLRQAIESVLEQTYEDFEVLVVDDGSSDDTTATVAKFNDSRIVYLRQGNAGRSVARNRGMAQARGDYIGFLDDDDLYLPHKLAVQMEYLDGHPEIGLVAGGTRLISADGTLIREWQTWLDQPQLLLPRCLYACPLLTCSVLFRRQWLSTLDDWFDRTLDRAEDTDFWIRLLLAGCRMAWTYDIVCIYRLHQENSQQDGERYYRGYLTLLDKLYARNDLQTAVLQERPAIYAHYHAVGACQAYAVGQADVAKERLLCAAVTAPGVFKGNPPPIIASIVSVAQHRNAKEANALICRIFDHLPQQLAHLSSYRRFALSSLHMQRVFMAHAARMPPRFSDWWLGVLRYPRWLANRGIWSILMHDLLLRPPAAKVKS